MQADRWTKANRATEVTAHSATLVKVGRGIGPSLQMINAGHLKGHPEDDFSKLSKGDDIWQVVIRTRTGLDKEAVGFSYFLEENEAANAVSSPPVGCHLDDGIGFPIRFRDIVHPDNPIKS